MIPTLDDVPTPREVVLHKVARPDARSEGRSTRSYDGASTVLADNSAGHYPELIDTVILPHIKLQSQDSMVVDTSPGKVKVGALILGRGSVYEYPTRFYLDRQQLPGPVWWRMLNECIPCTESIYCSEPMVESHPGSEIPIKQYAEDVEQTIFENQSLDGIGKRKLWRLCTSSIVMFLLMLLTFLLSTVKWLAEMEQWRMNWMTLFETKCAVLCVVIRLLQTLVLYWQERETRHILEVSAWDDGTVTRGRPLSLFVLIWVYSCLQILSCCVIIFGALSLVAMEMPHWTVLSTCLPVFVLSELISSMLQRHLALWEARALQDQLRVALIEANTLFEESWLKIRDYKLQNKIYSFKEAVSSSFHLDTYKLSYIRNRQDVVKV